MTPLPAVATRATPVAGPRPHLGVHLSGDGIDVAVLASHATAVELCLIDDGADGPTERRLRLTGPSLGVFSGHVSGVTAGQRYGFRAYGPWDPSAGLRYNPAKLLVDPWARGLVGELAHHPATYGHRVDDSLVGNPYGPPDDRDSLPFVPHSVVVDQQPTSPNPAANRPWVPQSETVIYEAHVKGLTQQLGVVPEHMRGTYAALGHHGTVSHLRALGVTTLELLPIHAFTDEPHLVAKGLTNYWGYNTLGFFAPHAAYATPAAREAGPQAIIDELRTAVHALHAAGIEVVLDVVYNHTAEGGLPGQHLSWRGLDPTLYYRHDGGTPAAQVDTTGCGNSLDFRRREVVRLAVSSLRYWADVIGVDGFRFDLATTLGRRTHGFAPDHPFLVAMSTDPVLSRLKLIAEPWDVGPGGWQTGGFPVPFSEWNDRFRDAVRSFWLTEPERIAHGGAGAGVRELATRLSGSVDLFAHTDPPLMRGTAASINFVTAHDGYTLADLATYQYKHNEANGEANRDGTDNNLSWNHGIEGPIAADSIASDIIPLRRRSIRNLMATLLLSAGTPMVTAGDEVGRTQRGNNNAYCHDSELSWVDWRLSPWRRDLLATTRHLLALRRLHPALRTTGFFTGASPAGGTLRDLVWFSADGTEFTHEQWQRDDVRTIQMLRSVPTDSGPDSVLLVINGALDTVDVHLPPLDPSHHQPRWELAWDSTWEHPDERRTAAIQGALHEAPGDLIVVDDLSCRVYLPA